MIGLRRWSVLVTAIVWISENGTPLAQTAPTKTAISDPCTGRSDGVQAFAGVCLPDRLVAYLVCVEKLGGNRIKVSKDDSKKSQSDVRVDVSGKGQGVIVKGDGAAGVATHQVDETIKKLDVIYGDRATDSCLIAAGLKKPKSASDWCESDGRRIIHRLKRTCVQDLNWCMSSGARVAYWIQDRCPKVAAEEDRRYPANGQPPPGRPFSSKQAAEIERRHSSGTLTPSGLEQILTR